MCETENKFAKVGQLTEPVDFGRYSMFPIKRTVFLCTVTLVKNTVRLIGNIEYIVV